MMERRNAQAAGGKRLAVEETPEKAGGTKNQVRPLGPYPTLTANR